MIPGTWVRLDITPRDPSLPPYPGIGASIDEQVAFARAEVERYLAQRFRAAGEAFAITDAIRKQAALDRIDELREKRARDKARRRRRYRITHRRTR